MRRKRDPTAAGDSATGAQGAPAHDMRASPAPAAHGGHTAAPTEGRATSTGAQEAATEPAAREAPAATRETPPAGRQAAATEVRETPAPGAAAPSAAATPESRKAIPYKPISDYGIIGDMRSAALVARDGSIDWCCFPDFDGPSVFARILDNEIGGFWSVAPLEATSSHQQYEDGTNILLTEFDAGGGHLSMLDFMPVADGDPLRTLPHEIHRRLDATGGNVEIEIRFRPRFDYARSAIRLRLRTYGVIATDAYDETLTLSSSEPLDWKIDDAAGEAFARFTLERGARFWMVLRYDDDEVWPIERYQSRHKLNESRKFWLDWTESLAYDGKYRRMVERSALVLKLMCFIPTGSIVAAPTTSLPEEIGGVRNWDYRFTWLRDSTYTLFAFYVLGRMDELDRYTHFLKRVCRKEAEFLQIMYGIRGELTLPEEELPHLEGYRNSAPVRIGNAAVDQLQLDVYGEVLDAVHIWHKNHEMTEGMWAVCRRLADWVCDNWRQPDSGPWEVRDDRRHFVFSKVMCWVALDRALRAAENLPPGTAVQPPDDATLERWREGRDEIHRQVLEKGWNEERQCFVQHYETDRTDAVNLVIPLVRFLPADDPRIKSTIKCIREELGDPETGLLYRYLTPDGLPGGEGTFVILTFLLSQALALSGDREEASRVFESVLEYASPLGLLSEEIDPHTKELLGNFPQAFSHIGMINAAHILERTKAPDRGREGPLLPEPAPGGDGRHGGPRRDAAAGPPVLEAEPGGARAPHSPRRATTPVAPAGAGHDAHASPPAEHASAARDGESHGGAARRPSGGSGSESGEDESE